MKISIITVCYNEEKNISKTIESVLEQTSNQYEYIICDGKSKDDTVKIAQSYEEKFRVKDINFKVYSEKDGGIYFGMNNGIDRASGDYIIFINAGDKLYDKNVIARVTEIIGDRRSEVFYGDCLFVYRNIGTIVKSDHNNLSYHMSIAHPATLVRKDVIKDNKFDISFKIAADYNMMLDLRSQDVDFVRLDMLVSVFYCDGISSIHLKDATLEACRAKKIHGIECDENKEIQSAKKQEKKNKFKNMIPKFIMKLYYIGIKKRRWIEI